MALIQKSFSDIITFSRSSNATRVGPTGLVQYAPHNLVLRSQEFDNASWTKGNTTVTANAAAGPDGTVTADKAIISAATAITQLYGSITGVIGQPYTVSVYAKKAELQYVNVGFIYSGGVWAGAQFDLNAGTVVRSDAAGSGASVSSATISSVGNGWYRCSVVVTLGFTTLFPNACPSNTQWTSGRLDQSLTGDGTSGIYLWGAQLSVGPYALDYTPTTSAAVYGPRFDYDPVTLAARGLLVEEQRTNLVTWSEQFDNAAWTKSVVAINANASASPDGTVNADLLYPTSSGANPLGCYQNKTASSSGTKYCLSVFAKASGKNFLMLGTDNTVGWVGWFNLSTGTVGTMASGYSGTISNFGNGWYRCAITWDGAVGRDYPFIGASDSDGSGAVVASGSNGILIWGAQFESSASFATSYIPTLASTVTRSADLASVDTLTPWMNQTEGTIFAEYLFYGADAAYNNTAVMLTDGTENNYETIFGYNPAYGWVQSGGATSAGLSSGGSTTINTNYKAALAFKANDFAFSLNGGAAVTDTSGSVPTVTQMLLGRRVSNSKPLHGYLRRVAFFPRRLSNAEIQALTA